MFPVIAALFAIFAAVLWGLEAPLQKLLMRRMESETYFLMAGLPIALMWVVVVILHRKSIMKDIKQGHILNLKTLLTVGAVSVLCGMVPIFITLRLLKNYPATIVTAVTSIYPLFTLLVAKFILKERTSPLEIVAVLLITFGVMILVTRTPESFLTESK